MLEFGGKINAPYTYKAFFETLGYRHISVDWNGQHGALVKDLREPLGLGTFDMVTNIGTSEHVNGQEGVWRNMVEACHVGSVLVCTTPLPGDWTWHGDRYPLMAFYFDLAQLNGYLIERNYVAGIEPRRMIFCRMVRQHVAHFEMPPERLIYRNVRQ